MAGDGRQEPTGFWGWLVVRLGQTSPTTRCSWTFIFAPYFASFRLAPNPVDRPQAIFRLG